MTGTGVNKYDSLSIIIPFRATCERRKEIFDWMIQRYKFQHPSSQIIVADSTQERFNVSEARNIGASQADGDILFFTDADTLTYVDQVRRAFDFIKNDPAQWIVGQKEYYIATNETTDIILSKPPVTMEDFRHLPMSAVLTDSSSIAGGYMVTREQFDSVRGFDERFVGWGYEDTAFLVAMETLWDYNMRMDNSYVIHLEHPAVRFDSPNIHINEALFQQYMSVALDRDKMLELVNSR